MDDPRANRTGGLKNSLWWIGVMGVSLAGAFGGMLAWQGFLLAAKNYNPQLAMVMGAAIFGFIGGAAYGVAMSHVVRRYKIKFTRYSVRDMLIVLMVAAIGLGMALNILNRK